MGKLHEAFLKKEKDIAKHNKALKDLVESFGVIPEIDKGRLITVIDEKNNMLTFIYNGFPHMMLLGHSTADISEIEAGIETIKKIIKHKVFKASLEFVFEQERLENEWHEATGLYRERVVMDLQSKEVKSKLKFIGREFVYKSDFLTIKKFTDTQIICTSAINKNERKLLNNTINQLMMIESIDILSVYDRKKRFKSLGIIQGKDSKLEAV